MGYIEIKEETVQLKRLVCSHPLVTKIWESGGIAENPSNSQAFRYVNIVLNDGSRHEFKDEWEGKAIEDAEEFLKSLDISQYR